MFLITLSWKSDSQERTSLKCCEFCFIADAVSPNLTDCDVVNVYEEECKAKDKWNFIGLKLGVFIEDIESIE